MTRLIGASVATLFLLGSASTVIAQVRYTVTDLGTGGFLASYPGGINGGGQVAGTDWNDLSTNYTRRAFVWFGGDQQALGTLGDRRLSEANAINDSGQVVGSSFNGSYGDYPFNERAFIWSPDQGMVDIGLPQEDSVNVTATGINARGEVAVTTSIPGRNADEAFLWSGGVFTDLGRGHTSAINDNGQIAGYDEHDTAVVWDSDGRHDLGLGIFSFPRAINAWGAVVGRYFDGSNDKAFFWDPVWGVQDLGTLGTGRQSGASSINGTLIVGSSVTNENPSNQHAFLYDLNGPGYMVDLNDLIPPDAGWVLTGARGINAAGQIVGTGIINGEVHAYLLTPQATDGR